jgi:thiol-disulfide isomerase/thioredoxin
MSFGKWSQGLLAILLLAGCTDIAVELGQSQSAANETEAPASGAKSTPSLFPTRPLIPPAAGTKAKMPFVKGYARGSQQATATGKPMLVFFTADWCHHCHQMADEAFVNPQVVGLADRFVCVLVDADAEPEVCKQFRVQYYPTVQFLSVRGMPLNRLVGRKPTDQVTTAMQAALQNVARAPSETKTKQR